MAPSRTMCSIALEHLPGVYEWVEDDRKLRVFSRRAAQVTPEQIRAHQQMLKDAGFNPGSIDGLWGRGTEDATRKWEATTGGAQQSYRYTDIEWDPPETIEEPILDIARLVIGKRFNEKREMVSIPDKERIKLRSEMPKWRGQVKDPRWQKLLKWWNDGRPPD